MRAALTVLRWIDDGCKTEGSLPFTVERFDFNLKLGQWWKIQVFVDVAPGQGVGHHHLPPLLIFIRSESHDVAKVGPVVVLRLHGLLTAAWKNDNNKWSERWTRAPEKH